MKPESKPKPPVCKACDDPDRNVKHTCGLAKLQKMLGLGGR